LASTGQRFNTSTHRIGVNTSKPQYLAASSIHSSTPYSFHAVSSLHIKMSNLARLQLQLLPTCIVTLSHLLHSHYMPTTPYRVILVFILILGTMVGSACMHYHERPTAISSGSSTLLRMFLYIGVASYCYSNNVYIHDSQLNGHLELQRQWYKIYAARWCFGVAERGNFSKENSTPNSTNSSVNLHHSVVKLYPQIVGIGVGILHAIFSIVWTSKQIHTLLQYFSHTQNIMTVRTSPKSVASRMIPSKPSSSSSTIQYT
jgi:hypothetical protein